MPRCRAQNAPIKAQTRDRSPIISLTLCILRKFACFLSPADFFQNKLLRKFISGIQSESNSLDPYQARHFVGPDLGPKCLQKLSADNSRIKS